MNCKLVNCTDTSSIASYVGNYSLNAGLQYTNVFLKFNVGGQTVEIPAGTITVTVPPNVPQNGGTVDIQGCLSPISITIPSGSSASQIQALVSQAIYQVAQQQAQCNAANNPNSPQPPPQFLNTQQTAPQPCADGGELIITGALPTGVTFDGNNLICAAGIFSSNTSQADANQRAEDFLASTFNQLFHNSQAYCQWWNDEETVQCQYGSPVTVPAHTYSSTVSKADANDQAIAAAESACPPPPFSCAVSYPTQPTSFADVTWTSTSFNESVEYEEIISQTDILVGWPVTDIYSDGMKAGMTTNHFCVNEDTPASFKWTMNLSNGFHGGATTGHIALDGIDIFNFTAPNSGSTNPFTQTDTFNFTIPQGSHTLEIYFTNSGFGAPSVTPATWEVKITYPA